MKNISRTAIIIAVVSLLSGILIGWAIFSSNDNSPVAGLDHETHAETIWTCSMHPQIRQSEPGKCPICGMDLIPLNNNTDESPVEIRMSPTAMQLANVQTSIVSYQKPVKEVRMNGRIKVDERKIYSQTSHIPGRIEKLLVSFTGESIVKGQVLAYIYSPDLVNAQEELFEAYRTRNNQPALYEAARQKLLNWKLTNQQIDEILEYGEPHEDFPVLADMSGVVLEKKINLGDHVKKGESLFEVADLSSIWVLFDVYESDISWVKKGNEVSFTIYSMPGETFKGIISFVDPVINPKTRVVTARVDMKNPALKLKPDMFAVGIVKSPINDMKEELIVPKSAVMWTGERSVVYVKKNEDSGINFIMQEVVLGPALGESYIVKEGLEEGEEIATNGTFSIDAAAQLAGKPSMMNPEHGLKPRQSILKATSVSNDDNGPVRTKSKLIVSDLLLKYLVLKKALASDDFEKSKEVASTLLNDIKEVKMADFIGEDHERWMQFYNNVLTSMDEMARSTNIGELRREFKILSDNMIILAVSFGPFDKDFFVQHCPMANDNNGADWISEEKKILNPYFGASMLGCGSVTKEILKK